MRGSFLPTDRRALRCAWGQRWKRRMSAKLIEDLTAQRTAALRAVLASNPDVALAAVVHGLALPIFYGSFHDAGTCLDVRVTSTDLGTSAEGIQRRREQRLAAAKAEQPALIE